MHYRRRLADTYTSIIASRWACMKPETAAKPADKDKYAPERLQVLDGLRGLAVLIVLASHLSNHRILGNTGFALAGTGKSGVYLFFVLSAFLLTRLLLAKSPAQLASAQTWLDYALRRVVRIWPLYLVILLLSLWLAPWMPAWHYRIDMPALWQHLTLKTGQSVLWSIPVEFKAYLVLPVIVAMVVALRRLNPWVTATAFVVAFLVAMWSWPTQSMGVNTVDLGPYLTTFIAGASAAWLDLRLRRSGRLATPMASTLCGAWVLAMLAAWVALTPLVKSMLEGSPVAADFNHHWIPLFALLWSSLLLAVLYAGRGVQTIFDNVPMRYLGLVSFSLYLWHMVVIDLWKAAGWPSGPWPAVGLVALVVAVSSLSYLLIERPFRRMHWPAGRMARGGQPSA